MYKECPNYEPKKHYLFSVEFSDKSLEIIPPAILSVSPIIYNATDHIWKNIKITFIDYIGPSTAQELYKLIDLLNADEIKLTITIKYLDPTGEPISEWCIYVKNIPEINFDGCTCEDTDIVSPFIIVEPKYAELKY